MNHTEDQPHRQLYLGFRQGAIVVPYEIPSHEAILL